MCTHMHSHECAVATKGPRETFVPPERSDADRKYETKDIETTFREAFERSKNMTSEEIYEEHSSWSE